LWVYKRVKYNHNLAHLAKLPKGLYILLALFSFFFNDRSEKTYLRIRWTDFRNLCTK